MTASSRVLVADLMAHAPAWRLPSWAPARIRVAAPPGWEVRVLKSPTVSDGDGADRPSAEAVAAVRDAEVYAGFGVPAALLEAAPKLRWVHTATAGVGGLLTPTLRARDLLLTNSAGVHAVPIAEYVLAGVLHFLRGLDVALHQQREGRWEREPFVGPTSEVRELGECRALIVGTGGIGAAVAERFSALGVRCTGIRRRPDLPTPRGFERVLGFGALDAALSEAELLVLAAPLTAETRGLIGGARLDRLPPGAIVANVARGALLDERALVERLAAGALRGAVLDVFDREPLAPESPLWAVQRVLVTPHVSAVSPRRFWERELALLLDNWTRYDAGAPLRNLVDQDAGY